MKRRLLLLFLVFCTIFLLSSCSIPKTLKLEDNAVIKYDFKSFENLKPGKIYPVTYKTYSTENLKVITYTSPAELYVVRNMDGTISYYIQYVEYGNICFENITLEIAKYLSENNEATSEEWGLYLWKERYSFFYLLFV